MRFAINPLKSRKYSSFLICKLSKRNFVSFVHFLNWVFINSLLILSLHTLRISNFCHIHVRNIFSSFVIFLLCLSHMICRKIYFFYIYHFCIIKLDIWFFTVLFLLFYGEVFLKITHIPSSSHIPLWLLLKLGYTSSHLEVCLALSAKVEIIYKTKKSRMEYGYQKA